MDTIQSFFKLLLNSYWLQDTKSSETTVAQTSLMLESLGIAPFCHGLARHWEAEPLLDHSNLFLSKQPSLLALAILLQHSCSLLLCPFPSLTDVIPFSCYCHPFHLSQSRPSLGISNPHLLTFLQGQLSKFGLSASLPFSYPHLSPPFPISSPIPQPLLCWFHHLLLSSISSHNNSGIMQSLP